MIQFNLLPDVKIEFIKAKRTKHAVAVIATFASAVSVVILALLFTLVNVVQKKHLDNLSGDISERSKKLQSIPDIGKILTIQNQLLALDGVHNNKPVVSRLRTYIEQVTPDNVGISELEINFTENKGDISGIGKSLADINKFADTLKFTKYSAKPISGDAQIEKPEEKVAFLKVVLKEFGHSEGKITYKIEFEFDPAIFSAASDVSLNVPKITTTRSELEKPSALFQFVPKPDTPEEGR